MSKSVKKTPIFKSVYVDGKKRANKKVRKEKQLSSGNYYKKVANSWNIHDQVSYIFEDEYYYEKVFRK